MNFLFQFEHFYFSLTFKQEKGGCNMLPATRLASPSCSTLPGPSPPLQTD